MTSNEKNQNDIINSEFINSYKIDYIFSDKPINRFKIKPKVEDISSKLDDLRSEIEKICNKVGLDVDSLTFNPEFFREGTAVEDFFKPDRIVIGGNDSSKVKKLEDLYSNFKAEIIITDPFS